MEPTVSAHAAARAQQRGIRPRMVRLLIEEGAPAPAGAGLVKVYFDAPARRRLRRRAAKGDLPAGWLYHAWGTKQKVPKPAQTATGVGTAFLREGSAPPVATYTSPR